MCEEKVRTKVGNGTMVHQRRRVHMLRKGVGGGGWGVGVRVGGGGGPPFFGKT